MRWSVVSLALAGCAFEVGGVPAGQVTTDGAVPTDAPGTDSDAALVADAAPPDAAPPDASFTPAQCPASYDRVIGSSPGSAYRFIATGASFAVHHADCSDDRPGWTHLIVLDDMAEAEAIGQYNPTSYTYVGAVQQPGQTQLAANWYRFDGQLVTTGWSPLNNQPDDGDGIESGAESLAVVASTGNMHDVGGVTAYAAVCECDGQPIDPTIATYLP